MGRLKRTNMSVPYVPEAGQFRNVAVHNFALRRVTPPQPGLENKMSARLLADFLKGSVNPVGLSFDVWRYTRHELYALILGVFRKHGLLEILVRFSRRLLLLRAC